MIASPFPPLRNRATIDSTKATGRRIQPMMKAPGTHAKMKPMIATTKAMIPRTFLGMDTAPTRAADAEGTP